MTLYVTRKWSLFRFCRNEILLDRVEKMFLLIHSLLPNCMIIHNVYTERFKVFSVVFVKSKIVDLNRLDLN